MTKNPKQNVTVTTEIVKRHTSELDALHAKDNELLAELGYKSEFQREFSVSAYYEPYRISIYLL